MNSSKVPPPALDIAALTAGYGTLPVLEDVNLTVQRGEWYTILGPNGVGKSTLLHCIVGRIDTFGGAIRLCGRSVNDDRFNALHHLGFACAPENIPNLLTGRQCLEVYAAAKGLERIAADTLELAEKLRLTPYLDRYVDTYSLGTRQKLSILLALQGNPSLLVLDEAFNGLDPASALTLKQLLRSKVDACECGVLLATHALDIALHFSDSAGLLLNGRIVRQWDHQHLHAMRNGRPDSFEIELAAAAAAGAE